jgi:hypothetical protein
MDIDKNKEVSMKDIGNFLVAFVIGAMAGVAPFVVMQILPSLLNPGTPMTSGNTWALILWGAMIGLITTIFFGKKLNAKEADPKEVFIQALGIPAILIATITNFSTLVNTKTAINDIQTRASADINQSPGDENNDIQIRSIEPPSPVQIDGKNKKGAFWLFPISKAYADTAPTASSTSAERTQPKSKETGPQDTAYLVSLGIYEDSASAIKDCAAFSKMKIKTDNYIAGKNLEVLSVPSDQGKAKYIVKYARFAKKEKAVKAFRLLRVNDPSFDVQIFKF